MPQKMLDVRPETFLQGVAQYSYDDMLNSISLGALAATESDILMGLRGVGRLAQVGTKSVMDAIISNAAEMNQKVSAVEQARRAAAAKSPTFAVALAKKQAQTSMPGANEAKGVVQELNAAAKKAVAAKKEEQAAKVLLAQSDKRGAAAKAVNAMTLAREAAIMANKAERTRITRSLDILANTLKAQADYIDGVINLQVKRSGDNARSMALAATAQNLREQVKRLQAMSGTVAALPTVPPNAPTQQRIADLANKFNIRTAAEQKMAMNRAVVSVLSDLSENPMAQVKDYAGAVTFYGSDGAGQVMADMEFGNYGRAVSGIRGMVHGIGYFDTTAIMAQADATVSAAHKLADKTYTGVVLPAAGLGNLSGLGDMESDHGWCNRNNSNAKPGGFPASELDKCKKCPNPISPPGSKKNEFGYYEWFGKYECLSPSPESPVGRQGRGMTVDWGKVVAGWTAPPPPPAAAPPPPPAAAPPPQVSIEPITGGPAVGTGSAASTAAPKDNTMLYVGLGLAGAAVIGTGVYFAFFRK